MTHTIKLTSKRQATLPSQLCLELGIRPGDDLLLERKDLDEGTVWVLKPKPRLSSNWFARLKHYARDKDHDMDAIRRSVGKHLGSEK